MNKKHLNQIFEAYIDKFRFLNADPQSEYYKWIAIREFQDVFDLEAPDFHAMLKKARIATRNTIDSRTQPFGALVRFAYEDPERVRGMFRNLYAEDGGDLVIRQEKIQAFLRGCEELCAKYFSGSGLYQNNLRSAMGYLFFHDPDHHYLYKATEATALADCVEFYDDWGTMSNFKLNVWHRFCDELIGQIKATPEIIETHRSRFEHLDNPVFPDNALHVLLFDIIYCSHNYNLYSGIDVVKITSSSRKLYRENKANAQKLLAAVEKAEADSDSLSHVYAYFFQVIGSHATVTHKTLGDLEVVKLEHELHTNALVLHARILKNNEIKAFQLLPTAAGGFIRIDVPGFAEKVVQYKSVMLLELDIQKNLAASHKNLLPYADYLD